MPSSAFYESGRYLCRLGRHDLIEKPKGPQLTIRFQVLGRYDQAGESQPTQQYERTYYRVINENTGEYFLEDLRNLGVSISSFAQLDPEAQDGISFDGMQADMWCSHKPAQDGGTKEEWGVAKRGGSSAPIEGKRADRSALRKLDNLFGKALAPRQSKPQPQPIASPDKGGYRATSGDVPF